MRRPNDHLSYQTGLQRAQRDAKQFRRQPYWYDIYGNHVQSKSERGRYPLNRSLWCTNGRQRLLPKGEPYQAKQGRGQRTSILFHKQRPTPSPFYEKGQAREHLFARIRPSTRMLQNERLPTSCLTRLFQEEGKRKLQRLQHLRRPSPAFQQRRLNARDPRQCFSCQTGDRCTPTGQCAPKDQGK